MIKNSSVYSKILFAVIAISGLSLLVACGGAGYTPPPPVVRSAILDSAQVVIPGVGVGGTAAGLGGVVVDPTTKVITGGITSSTGITGTIAHIHIAKVGAIGDIIITLNSAPGGVWNIPPNKTLLQSEYDALLADGLYFDVHDAADKQIRGQINIKP